MAPVAGQRLPGHSSATRAARGSSASARTLDHPRYQPASSQGLSVSGMSASARRGPPSCRSRPIRDNALAPSTPAGPPASGVGTGWARGRPPAGCSPAGPGSLPFPSGPVAKSIGDGNGRARARRPCPVVRPSCSGRAHAPGRGAGLPQDPSELRGATWEDAE